MEGDYYRSRDKGKILGVCRGLEKWTGICAPVFRIGFIILLFALGVFKTIALYIVLSLIVDHN